MPLAGCKGVVNELGENLFQGVVRIVGKIVGNIFKSDSDETTTEQESLPFILDQEDQYKLIESEGDSEAYYHVKRKNGVIEYYSLEGDLIWSNEEASIDEYDDYNFESSEVNNLDY